MGKHHKAARQPKNDASRKGRRSWTTDAQAELLNTYVPAYVSAQTSKQARSDFWPSLWEGYFGKFPLPLTTDKEKEEGVVDPMSLKKAKKRIKEWFNNHTRQSFSGGRRKQMLNLTSKKPKLIAAWQAYSLLYYDTRVKDIVVEQWPAARDRLLDKKANGEDIGKDPPKAAPLWFRNQIVREEYKIETDEVKEEVAKYQKALQEDGTSEIIAVLGDDVSPEEAARVRKAVAQKKAQSLVPRTMANILDQIKEQTGYIGFVVLAAPDGQRGGAIKTLSCFSGKTPLGHDFAELYKQEKWKTQIMDPFGKFAEMVYPPDVRKAWALPSPKADETLVDSSDSPRASTVDPQPDPSKGKGTAANKAKNPRGNAAASRAEPSDDVETFDLDGVNSDSEDETEDETENETEDETETDTPPKSKKPDAVINLHEDWDNGEVLTPEQRKKIMVMGSNYERSKAMNMIRNARLIEELGVRNEAQKLFEGGRVEQTKALSSTNSTSANANADSTPATTSKPRSKLGRLLSISPPPDIDRAGGTPSLTPSDKPEAHDHEERLPLVDSHPYRDRWSSWMHPAVGKLDSVLDHPRWVWVLNKWLEFEDKLGYPYGQSKAVLIDKTKRLEELNTWLKNGRKMNLVPDISDNVATFGDAWMQWWSSLQPEWRGDGPNFSHDIPKSGGGWQELRKGGQNGFYLILLSFCWWPKGVVTSAGKPIQPHYSMWLDMFRDVKWALQQMVSELETSQKRVREENDKAEDPKPASKRPRRK